MFTFIMGEKIDNMHKKTTVKDKILKKSTNIRRKYIDFHW